MHFVTMDRRGFLHTLVGAAVAAQQLDIEKLLWTPGKKTIFIPPASYSFYVACIRPVGLKWRKMREGVVPEKWTVLVPLEEYKRDYPEHAFTQRLIQRRLAEGRIEPPLVAVER